MISFVRAVWMNLPLNIFSTTITVLTGLVIYAFYASCDPGTTGEISKDDEVHIFSRGGGLPGENVGMLIGKF